MPASTSTVRRVRNAYESLRDASEDLTSTGYVAVRKSDLVVVLDLLIDHRPNLGEPAAAPEPPAGTQEVPGG
jgi:hypothetical protein